MHNACIPIYRGKNTSCPPLFKCPLMGKKRTHTSKSTHVLQYNELESHQVIPLCTYTKYIETIDRAYSNSTVQYVHTIKIRHTSLKQAQCC